MRAEVEESLRRWADTRPSLTPNPSPSGRGALHPASVNWPWARGGSPRRAAGTAGGRPGLRKALGYAAAALALLLFAPAALAQTATLAASSVEDDTATLTLTNHSGDWYYKYTVPSGDTSCTLVSSGTYTASLSSLTPGTSYTYKAYSNSTCSTELTSDSTDAELLTKPGQVTGVGATSANTSLAVSWTALTGTVTGYKVQWKKGDESYTSGRTNTVTGGSSNSNSITGLTNDTRYTVRVTAYNTTGDGDASSEVTGTPRSGFGFNDTVDDQTWSEGTAVNVTLPAANGYSSCYPASDTYSLSPALPAGLSFNSARDSRVISGTPTGPMVQTQYTYSTWNEQCYKSASLTFNITVTGAIELSAASVALTEGGGSQTYNVKLAAQPNTNATISITTGDAGAVTVSPSSLTFTTTNWGTNQAVTLTPVNDADGADEAVTITHTAAGGGIGGKTASLTANVIDDDKGITLSKTSYTIREGSAWHNTHTVVLDTAPAGNVTVTETVTPSNLHQFLERSPRSLTFTTSNWNLPQQIEMKVASSATRTRNVAGSMVHRSSGGGYGGASATLTVVYIDLQTPGLTISPGTLSVAEGSTGTFTVKLGGAPNGNVTVAVASGDSGAATVSPTSLTFTTTTANWNTNRTVTVTAVQDADGNNETVTLTSTAAGGGFNSVSGTVTLTVTDDEKALLASNVTHDSATLTITNHTGDWYYKKTVPSGDTTCTLVSSGTYTASLSGLTPATSYTFKAYSNSMCSTEISSDSTDADFLTTPAKVTGVTAAGGADAGALDVGWTAVTGAASYKVQWKTSAQQWATSRQTTSTTTSKTISNLTAGTQYSVRVAASNTSGDGPWSDTATGTAAADGVTPSTTSLAVPEGGSASYTVVLDTAPSHAVTIAVAKQSGGDADLTVSPASLTFGATNWNSPQTVTVTAKQDSDTTAGTATLTHTATSSDSGYSGVTIANVTATEDDDDAHGVLVSKTAVPVPEGGSATWTVRLASVPSATVFIDLAKQSGGDADLTVSPAQLTFTTKGWDLPQTVTVTAAEDTDATRGTATITHAATSTDASYGGVTIASVTATEDDNDTLAGVTPSKTSLIVAEGGSATYTVVLDTAPSANVTIAVANRGQSADDSDLTVSPASLTFTSTNYSSAQTVTVSAAQDADDADGTAVVTHTATSTDASYGGITIANVTATEDDDETPGTAPTSADVTLAVSRDNRTAIPLSSLPFSDEDSADTLRGVRIVTLPAASAGTLGLVKTGIYTGASTVLCVGTITPIVAGQEVLDAVNTVLYFCPKDGFTHATFRFQVIDSQGRASEKTHTATLAGPPGQVTGLVAEAGSTYVRLRWTDPRNPAITGYEYRQRSGAGVTTWGAWKAMTGSGATTTSYAVSGLTNATAYTFQVRAKSAGGAGPIPSAAVTATPASGVVPAKTAGLQVVNLGFNTANTYVKVRLVWDDPNDPSITRYEAVRQLKSTSAWIKPIDWTNTHVPSSGATTTTTEFDAGSHEATYAFRVRAVNAAGNGPWSDTVSLELDSDGETPVLESVEPGNGKLRLRWTHSGSSLKNYGGYWGYRRGHAGTVTDTDLSSTQAGAAARSYVAGSLTNGSTYTWAVYSWGKRDADDPSARLPLYSNTRTLTLPAAPAKPAGLTAKATPGGAAPAWTDPKNGAITGWQYQHKAGAGSYGSWTRVPGSTAGTTSVSVSKLANGTEHKFKVRAVIEYETALGGTLAGAASDEASVTPVGVVVSKDRLALAEGGAAGAYTVKLSQAPTHNVTITVSVDGDGTVTADTDDVATGNQTTLTFTSTNYATARTVKVKAAEDDDGRDSTATITHAASSTDARYGNLTGLPGLTVAVTDNDALGITLSKASVTVAEGSTATYTVRLGVKPTSTVTLTIARASGGDADLAIADTDPGTTGTQNTLAFSTTNYATAQTVTVSAADDGDEVNGTATFTHTASGAGSGYAGASASLAATEADNERRIDLSVSTVALTEGGSTGTYTVALSSAPDANVTVAVASDDSGAVTASPSSLTFSTTNYSTAPTSR